MTFDARESSEQTGSPVELFEFQYGFQFMRYTNQDDPYTYLGKIFMPTNIYRPTAIEESNEMARNNIKIVVPRDLDVAELFRIYPPSEEVFIRVYKIHRTDVDQQISLEWDGRVLNSTWSGERAELHCENILTSFRRKGLRRPYQKHCPHDLYSQGHGLCNADKASKLAIITVASFSGSAITSPDIALESVTPPLGQASGTDGYFGGGILEWEITPDVWIRRTIKLHPVVDEVTLEGGDTIIVAQPIPELFNGAVLHIYPGCSRDKTFSGCQKFNNIPNFGGVPIAHKNPFGGSGIL